MARIRVAVEELDARLRRVHDRVVDLASHANGTHRHGAIRYALRDRHHVRRHAESLGRERGAQPAETRDYFIEDQDDAVTIADRAQLLEITDRRHQYAR